MEKTDQKGLSPQRVKEDGQDERNVHNYLYFFYIILFLMTLSIFIIKYMYIYV